MSVRGRGTELVAKDPEQQSRADPTGVAPVARLGPTPHDGVKAVDGLLGDTGGVAEAQDAGHIWSEDLPAPGGSGKLLTGRPQRDCADFPLRGGS